MQTKHQLFNQAINDKGYEVYLEIGIDDPNNNFNHVLAPQKIGVDPYMDTTDCHIWQAHNKTVLMHRIDKSAHFYHQTSEKFFEGAGGAMKFDISFIDGLHLEKTVQHDIDNCISRTRKGGIVFIDDCLPQTWQEALEDPIPRSAWRGTVYRAFWKTRLFSSSFCWTGVIEELNMGFIVPWVNPIDVPEMKWPTADLMTNRESYNYFRTHGRELFNVMSLDQFKEKFLRYA